jgi:hypothetical protein
MGTSWIGTTGASWSRGRTASARPLRLDAASVDTGAAGSGRRARRSGPRIGIQRSTQVAARPRRPGDAAGASRTSYGARPNAHVVASRNIRWSAQTPSNDDSPAAPSAPSPGGAHVPVPAAYRGSPRGAARRPRAEPREVESSPSQNSSVPRPALGDRGQGRLAAPPRPPIPTNVKLAGAAPRRSARAPAGVHAHRRSTAPDGPST